MSGDTNPPPILGGFSDIASDYRGLLCDIWGVVHNGVDAHAPAVDALVRFRDGGGRVVLITNAPRPAAEVRKQLRALKVPDAAFDAIVTSGDVTRRLLEERTGQTFFHLGPERDLPVFKGFEKASVAEADAGFVLCTGLYDDVTETPEDYRDMLERFRSRGLEMICANPDLVVERGGDLVYCAGSLALAYEQAGGKVVYAGKPHLPIYDIALAMLREAFGGDGAAELKRGQVLAIGDSVRTDLKGAVAAGLDALFIVGGIHAGELSGPTAIADMFAQAGATPRAVMDVLRW